MSDTDVIEIRIGLWANLIVPLEAQIHLADPCQHERSDIYGVHAVCECGEPVTPSSPQVPASAPDE